MKICQVKLESTLYLYESKYHLIKKIIPTTVTPPAFLKKNFSAPAPDDLEE